MYPKVLDVYAQRRVAEDQTYNGRIFLVLAIGAGADWYLQRLCGIVRFMLEAYARERAGPHIVQRGMAPEATHAGAEQSLHILCASAEPPESARVSPPIPAKTAPRLHG